MQALTKCTASRRGYFLGFYTLMVKELGPIAVEISRILAEDVGRIFEARYS